MMTANNIEQSKDNFFRSMHISTAGMKAQSLRMRVVTENIANANSTATQKGGLPYARKTITFKEQLNKKLGISLVTVDKIQQRKDINQFKKKYDPYNPVADDQGYILTPNVNTIIETYDMQEAMRSYSANLNMIKGTKSMLSQTIGLLR